MRVMINHPSRLVVLERTSSMVKVKMIRIECQEMHLIETKSATLIATFTSLLTKIIFNSQRTSDQKAQKVVFAPLCRAKSQLIKVLFTKGRTPISSLLASI